MNLVFSAKLILHYCVEAKFNQVSDQQREKERDK